mmetsp:Transcript_42593/g.99995  ORF Transcript_42593/g.99995 Transcript_42593/m.99995 type:complete len:201 (-) Transcript_42593:941-1543(-)
MSTATSTSPLAAFSAPPLPLAPPFLGAAALAAFLSSSVMPSKSFFFAARVASVFGTSSAVRGIGTPMVDSDPMVSTVSVILTLAGAGGGAGPPPPFFLPFFFAANPKPKGSSSSLPAFLPISPFMPSGRGLSSGLASSLASSLTSLGMNALSTFSRSMHIMISSAQGCPTKGKRSSVGTSSSIGAAISARLASYSARRCS